MGKKQRQQKTKGENINAAAHKRYVLSHSADYLTFQLMFLF